MTTIVQTAPQAVGTSTATVTLPSSPTVGNALILLILSEGAPPSGIGGFVLQAADSVEAGASTSRYGRTAKTGDGKSVIVNLNSPSIVVGWELAGYTVLGGG